MRFKICLIILALSILVLIHCSNDTSEDSFFQDEIWKKENEWENRYEGVKSIQVGAPPVQLIAFHSHQQEFKPNDILKVKFYLQKTSKVHLTAQELITNQFYWMETKPQQWKQGWNEFSPWPVKDVLAKLEISHDNLGILLRLDSNYGSGLISPIILWCKSPPSEIVQYIAYFRPGMSFDHGTFEILRGCDQRNIIIKGKTGTQSAGVPFPIIFRLGNDWEGLVKLRIIIHARGQSTPHPSREYCFYHVPIVKDL